MTWAETAGLDVILDLHWSDAGVLGSNWAYDLSGVPANRIDGHNIVYATHPYNSDGRRPYSWEQSWGFLTVTAPVIITEFGELNDTKCATDYSAQLIQYADAHAASWTAWAWFPGGCGFPAIINDWNATPSAVGAIVKAALLGYHDPPASPPREPKISVDGGASESGGSDGNDSDGDPANDDTSDGGTTVPGIDSGTD